MMAKKEINLSSLCYKEKIYEEVSWQYHVIVIRTRERIPSVLIMRRSQGA
jgi:hypothetical protein